jgi:hypothetical protein
MRQPVLMESDLARARTHTLTSSASAVVDRQRATSILAAGSGARAQKQLAGQPPVEVPSAVFSMPG